LVNLVNERIVEIMISGGGISGRPHGYYVLADTEALNMVLSNEVTLTPTSDPFIIRYK
jgi:hypothetical protein